MDAVLCPICNAVNPAEASECMKCEAKFPEPRRERDADAGEGAHLRKVLQLSREKAKARTGPPPVEGPGEESPEPPSFTQAGTSDDLEQALWKLSEPFDRMLQRRRRRLMQMEGLISRARERVQALADSTDPQSLNEREQLKRQVEDLLLEKEDVLKLEEGLVEMENTYRNILRLQQEELKARETSLRGRLDAFRKELEARERTFGRLRERESDMIRREDEFRRLVNRLHEREQDINQRDELMRAKTQLLDERHHQMSEAEVDIERRRWELEQRKSSQPKAEAAFTVVPPDDGLTEMRGRLTELEEQMERLTDEKNRLSEEHRDLVDLRSEVTNILKVLDDLLGQLPEERIRDFARSAKFGEYERLLNRLKV